MFTCTHGVVPRASPMRSGTANADRESEGEGEAASPELAGGRVPRTTDGNVTEPGVEVEPATCWLKDERLGTDPLI